MSISNGGPDGLPISGPAPLDGLTVLEVGGSGAGSFAGAVLADLGAVSDALESPLVRERGIVYAAEHPGVGTVRREAGFADQDPAALVEQGVIRSPVHSPTTQERTPWSSESPAAP